MPDTMAEYMALKDALKPLNLIETINLYALMCSAEAKQSALLAHDERYMTYIPAGTMIDVTYLRSHLALVLEAKTNWRKELGHQEIEIWH